MSMEYLHHVCKASPSQAVIVNEKVVINRNGEIKSYRMPSRMRKVNNYDGVSFKNYSRIFSFYGVNSFKDLEDAKFWRELDNFYMTYVKDAIQAYENRTPTNQRRGMVNRLKRSDFIFEYISSKVKQPDKFSPPHVVSIFDSVYDSVVHAAYRLRFNSNLPKGAVYSAFYGVDRSKSKVKRKDNVRRTIDTIYDIVRNNYFKSFVTLTINADCVGFDVSNVDLCRKYFTKFIDNIKHKCPDFLYVMVIERMKNGNVHAHLLTNLEVGTDLIPYKPIRRNRRKSKTGYQQIDYPEIYGWNLGHGLEKVLSDGKTQIVGTPLYDVDEPYPMGFLNYGFAVVEKCDTQTAKYLTKTMVGYLSKDFGSDFFGQRVMTHSRNVNRGFVVYNYVVDELYNGLHMPDVYVDSKTGEIKVCESFIRTPNVVYDDAYYQDKIYLSNFVPESMCEFLVSLYHRVADPFKDHVTYVLNNYCTEDYWSSSSSYIPSH